MTVKPNDSVVVNGELRVCQEVFRACGIVWIRHSGVNGQNSYATLAEWGTWCNE